MRNADIRIELQTQSTRQMGKSYVEELPSLRVRGRDGERNKKLWLTPEEEGDGGEAEEGEGGRVEEVGVEENDDDDDADETEEEEEL